MTDASPLFDQRLIWFLDANREGILHLLRPDQTNPPAEANLSLALETLRTGAETMCGLVDNAGAVAQKERLWAERDKVKAETERIKAETERIKAETEKIKAGKM